MSECLRFFALRGRNIQQHTDALYVVPLKFSRMDLQRATEKFRPRKRIDHTQFGDAIVKCPSNNVAPVGDLCKPEFLAYLLDSESLLLLLHMSNWRYGDECFSCINSWKRYISVAVDRNDDSIFGDTIVLPEMPEMIPLHETSSLLSSGQFSEGVKDVFRTYKDMKRIVESTSEKKVEEEMLCFAR